jgi:nucleotide-binding universal stress UspA family protein
MLTILAPIDPSAYAAGVVDHAAWAATKLGAGVELLHVIQRSDAVVARHDYSGAIGLAAKSGLMEELVRINEAEAKLARERGRLVLAEAESRLRAAGVAKVKLLHRHGGIIETVLEREVEADLVVIGKRGEDADFARGHIGSTVERIIRESIRPVLVAERRFTEPKTAVLAYDGGASARKAAQFMAASPLFADLAVHVVMAGPNDDNHRRHREWINGLLPDATLHELPGQPAQVVQEVVSRVGAQLLVMGAYGHSALRNFFVGSTTTGLMQSCQVPVLLFR